MTAAPLRRTTTNPLLGIGISLGCGLGLTAGILLGNASTMLVGAGIGVGCGIVVGAVGDLILEQRRALAWPTLPGVGLVAGAIGGALAGVAADSFPRTTAAGSVSGVALGILLTIVAKPKGAST